MSNTCDYHPIRPASWECPECGSVYCSGCVEKRIVSTYGKSNVYYFCSKCNVQTERISSANAIEPFGKRLHKFFAYPFHLRPLLLMVIVSIAMILFSAPGFINALIRFALWGVILKYSFASLKNTAMGKMNPPKVNMETISSEFDLVFKQIAIYAIIGLIFYKLAQGWGIVLIIPFSIVALLSLPAMMIVLVCTNSFLHAINPLVFMKMAWRIGWGYLLMYLFLGLLGGGPAIIAKFVILHLPVQLQGFSIAIVEGYYTIVAYHLMGYVIFQYHDEIGYEVEFEEEEALSESSPSEKQVRNSLLNRVDILVKDGNIDHAIALIKNETGDDISDLNLAERYYNLLRLREKTPEMLKHAKAYLDLLAKDGAKEILCEVYSECLSKRPDFAASQLAAFKIAGCLIDSGNLKGAVGVYQGFIKTNPNNPLVPKAYFLAANVINEHLKNPKKAVEILKGIINKYPNHEMLPYVRQYLGQIK
jgi:tetratricopeptide (TPR) repeat protein